MITVYDASQFAAMLQDPADPVDIMGLLYELASGHYTCLRPPGAAGAFLVTVTGHVVVGTVMPPPDMPTCKELGSCEMENGHCVRTIHAEQAAVIRAAKLGIATAGAIVYSLLKPCYQCTKVLATAGVCKILYAGMAYNEQRTIDICNANLITVERVDYDLGYG